VYGKVAQYRLKRGETVRLVTGTGGGYGDPHTARLDEVQRDVRGGYITPDMAHKDYGVTS
jgi:N-methylhydantoinase B